LHLEHIAVRLRRVTTQLMLTLDLARRIELAEAQAAVACAETSDGMPAEGRAVMSIADGFAVYCGANSPVTQAVALGLSGAVSEQEFEQLEQFYRSRQEPVRVETCPLADSSLLEHFGGNGYRVTEFSNVMARSLVGWNAIEKRTAAEGVTVEAVDAKEMELWTLTVAQGFSENFPVTQEILNVMKAFGSGSAVTCFLARIDGEIAGGATLSIRDGMAGLFGASTLPAFRKRGVQTALLRERLNRAARAGCDLAACLTQVGSGSQRNVMREDFTVLYTRVKFERAWS
jgi:GNAT superfamily N-acetyltransferase